MSAACGHRGKEQTLSSETPSSAAPPDTPVSEAPAPPVTGRHRAGGRHQPAPTGVTPGQRRALVGASSLGLAAAVGALLVPDPAASLTRSSSAGLNPGSSTPTVTRRSTPSPSRSSTPTTKPTKGTRKRPPRTTVTRPSDASPSTDRDASYSAATPAQRKRPSTPARTATSVRAASRALAAAPLLVRPGVMDPALVKKGLRNTPAVTEHLLARATFGARPADRAAVAKLGLDGWLARQLAPTSLADPEGDKIRAAFPLAGKSIAGVRGSVAEFSWDAMFQTGQLALGLQVHSSRQLYEIVVDVFANLLNVTMPSDNAWDCGSDYHRTVIRKHAFGRFEDMLLAAMRHPAMLRYLNNDESTKTSVNENLGRELLELHTVGVMSGYTETDVRNSAYILTGRTFDWKTGQFVHDPDRHWTGPVSVLGFKSSNRTASGGLAVGDAYLRYLARHEATARTVARKLAVRFVSDNPPKSLLDRLARSYLRNGTAIVPVLKTLFSSTEFWSAPQQKTRRPLEDFVGAARAVDVRVNGNVRDGVQGWYWNLQGAGHAPLAWIPPNGYPDVVAAWQSASSMVRRWNTHRSLTHSWGENMRPPQLLRQQLRPTKGMTYGAWVDLMSHRVIGKALDAPRKKAVLAFLEAKASTVVPDWMADPKNEAWLAGEVTALVLDGPHHQLR